jgi:hypothetical protein
LNVGEETVITSDYVSVSCSESIEQEPILGGAEVVPEKSETERKPENEAQHERAPKTDAKGRSVLEQARDVAFIATVYLFFTAYAYQYVFFRGLGIAPSSLNTSANFLLVSVYTVFSDNLAVLAISGCAVGIAGLALAAFAKRLLSPSVYDGGIRVFVVALALFSFPFLYVLANQSAELRIKEIRGPNHGGLKRFLFVLDPRKCIGYNSPIDKDFLRAARDGYVYLITETNDTLFVLFQPEAPTGGTDTTPVGFVFRVRRSDTILSKSLLPGRVLATTTTTKDTDVECK